MGVSFTNYLFFIYGLSSDVFLNSNFSDQHSIIFTFEKKKKKEN